VCVCVCVCVCAFLIASCIVLGFSSHGWQMVREKRIIVVGEAWEEEKCASRTVAAAGDIEMTTAANRNFSQSYRPLSEDG
jgi:hypothetical protein